MNAAEQGALLLKEVRNQVLWLTLNQPARRNPLGSEMLAQLTAALSAAAEDSQVRAIVITGAGPVFSAGHDLVEMSQDQGESLQDLQARMRTILDACAAMMLGIVHSPKAVIACVQGTATAAGCQLVSACDLALAADTATFCTPGVNLGTFCTTPLVGIGRNMHRKHAMAMALTGESFSAEEAVRFGLLNEAVPAELLQQRTTELAELIASKSAQGIRSGKEDFYRQIDMPIEEAFNYARESMVQAMTAPDASEGKRAFFEKRLPNWGDA